MRNLTNDYKDCKIVRLDHNDPYSPYAVMQEGCAPGDLKCRTRMFYLQHDGQWINEIARSTRPDSEIGGIVFETAAEALTLLSSLHGRPVVRALPVTEQDEKNYLARMSGGISTKDLLRQFLPRYRAAKGRS